MSYSMILDKSEQFNALLLARGVYQRNIILGIEALSGATLKGKARNWGAKYRDSRRNLLARMTAAGVRWSEIRSTHGKRVLVIG